MNDLLWLVLAASATALATGLGAIPVFFIGERARTLRPALLGLTCGVMTTAAIAGLLMPALDDGSLAEVVAGTLVGIAFLLLARAALHPDEVLGDARAEGRRTSLLVFVVLLVHSLPEGFAIGSAYASDLAGLDLFVILAIGIQNIPEGTSVAIPMAEAGYSRSRQFWAAVGTSAPQPVGAVIAYLLVDQVTGLLPLSFAFAAGAMLALVAVELAPSALERGGRLHALGGAAAGASVMVALALVLGV